MPVDKPKSGESLQDYLNYCIPIEIQAGKEQDQATAICSSIYRKEEMSKLRTSQEKFTAKLKYSQDFRGINLTNFGENSDACWDGYIQVGTKDLDGREVPDCRGPVDEMETQPQISSTYPGQGPTTSSLQEICPPATTDIALNLKNRKKAIDVAKYGPLNPNEPNEEYWEQKAEEFHSGDIQSAKKALCGNCVFFDITKSVLSCIEKGIGGTYAFDIIEAGQIGYCEAFDFKCAAERTCDAWVVGGPIVD
jgi:hypothetical protein